MIMVLVPASQGVEEDLIPTKVNGNALYVSPSGSTWSVIQDAIDNATSGDRIYIAPGNYSEGFLFFIDDVDIIGNSTEGEVNIRHFDSNAVVGISSDNSLIRGLRILEDGEHLYCMMVSQCRNITLEDIEIVSSTSSGLFITDSENAVLRNIKIDSGARESAWFRDMDGLLMEDFDLDCSESTEAVVFNDAAYNVELINGTIDMDHDLSTVFLADGGIGVTLDNISTVYKHEFINMEMGDVLCYDTFFGFDDVNITSGSVTDTVHAYVMKNIKSAYDNRYYGMQNASFVELNITNHEGKGYSTPYYGGTGQVSNHNGTFPGTFNFLFFNTTGGNHSYTEGRISIEAYYPDGEINNTIILEDIPLTNTDDILLEFRDIWHTNGSIYGHVKYGEGPMEGEPLVNATLDLFIPLGSDSLEEPRVTKYDWNMTFGTHLYTTTNSSGFFEFENVTFGHGFTLQLDHSDLIDNGGNISGYYPLIEGFDHVLQESSGPVTDMSFIHYYYNTSAPYPDSELDLTVPYYEFVLPTEGPITGTVKFDEGPKDGEKASNVTVELFDRNGTSLVETRTDTDGDYTFFNITYDIDYEIRATPSDADLGINNNRTGYLFWDGSAFNHYYNETTHRTGTTINISLKHYEYIPPAVHHPKVAIIDSGNDPLENVKVTLRVNDEEIMVLTDENGVAEFKKLTGLYFPEGSTFKAELEGYETIEWKEDDPVPKMKEEEEREDDYLLIGILAVIIIAVLAFAFILIFSRKKPVSETEE